jgi:hypothetical protein
VAQGQAAPAGYGKKRSGKTGLAFYGLPSAVGGNGKGPVNIQWSLKLKTFHHRDKVSARVGERGFQVPLAGYRRNDKVPFNPVFYGDVKVVAGQKAQKKRGGKRRPSKKEKEMPPHSLRASPPDYRIAHSPGTGNRVVFIFDDRVQCQQVKVRNQPMQPAFLARERQKGADLFLNWLTVDRVEIISPGKPPNSLTVEDVRYGNPVIRNNRIVAFGIHALPFSGLGTGLGRSLAIRPNIELVNDAEGGQSIVEIPSPSNSGEKPWSVLQNLKSPRGARE